MRVSGEQAGARGPIGGKSRLSDEHGRSGKRSAMTTTLAAFTDTFGQSEVYPASMCVRRKRTAP